MAEENLPISGVWKVEGTGAHFELKDSRYLNMVLDSAVPIKVVLESVPETITIHVESISKTTATEITLSGFLPLTTYYKYEDNYHHLDTFTTDNAGRYIYTQDLSKPHLIFIQSQASTIFLTNTGWSDPTVGNWDPNTRTAVLTKDLNETIQIDIDNVTLNGNGHTIIGKGTGNGIYLSGRTDITIKNINIKQFSYGIYIIQTHGANLMNNITSNNFFGIYLDSASGNTISNNTASNNFLGIILFYLSNSNNLRDNSVNLNTGDGIHIGLSNNNVVTGNTISNNSNGTYLVLSNDNMLVSNIVSTNSSSGIYLASSNNNTVANNTVLNNNNHGVYIRSSNNSKVCNNNFINNPTQAYISGGSGNLFNLNKPIGGNHWDNWSSPDSDENGFVDNPYTFSGGRDDLPWVKQDGWFVVAPSTLSEKSFTQSNLTETLVSQKANTADMAVTGDLKGTVDFGDFAIVSIISGPFEGTGFYKGQFKITLEGIPYTGYWQGVLFFKSQDRKIYLKGSVSGEISGIIEGYLIESTPGSGVYDQYQAAWKINRLANTITSASVNLNGRLVYQNPLEYPSTELYVLQTNIEGDISGRYSGSLNAVLTNLRISSNDNPYFGEGFGIISYTSEFGSGEGWAYGKSIEPGKIKLQGMFTGPLLGTASAVLNETASPRTLSINIEGVDLGRPPEPELKVLVWGMERVSSGQRLNYVIECRNGGLKAADEVILFVSLDYSLKYISASPEAFYNDILNTVSWNLGSLPPKSIVYLNVQVETIWGLPQDTLLESFADILPIEPHSDKKGIFVNGIGLYVGEKRDENYAKDCENFAKGRDVEWVPAYDTGSRLGDVGEVINAFKGIATEHNGLLNDKVRGGFEYETAWGYSGGARTLITAIEQGNLKTKELVLVSPVSTASFELEALHTLGVEKIIIYQSEKDKLPQGWFSQLKIPKNDPLRNQTWLEVRDKDDVIHTRWLVHLSNENNRNKEDMVSLVPSITTTAHDPNEKLVSPEGDVKPGDRLNYTINYENEGEGIAFGVYITDTLEEDMDDSTLIVNHSGSYDPRTRTVSWFIGELQSKQKGSVSFSVNAKPYLADGAEIINFATVYFPSVPETTRTNGVVNRITTVIDNVPPTTTAAASPSANQYGWNNRDVTVNLTSTDNAGGAGVKEIRYNLTGAEIREGTIQGQTGQVILTIEGVTTLVYRAIDNAGNIESVKSLTVNIDKTPPAVTITATPKILWPPNHKMIKVTIGGAADDNLSGIAQTHFNVEDEYNIVEPQIADFNTIIQLEARRDGKDYDGRHHTLSVTAIDKADNSSSASTIVICPHDQGG